MTVTTPTAVVVAIEEDLVRVRHAVRDVAQQLKFSIVDQTKLVTAASELSRNLFKYGGGGEVYVECVSEPSRNGVRVIFEDHGPGIDDIEIAMQDGFTTGGGMGLGMSGSKRLVNEFIVESVRGEGTRVTIARWK